jgi:hypothetical protein
MFFTGAGVVKPSCICRNTAHERKKPAIGQIAGFSYVAAGAGAGTARWPEARINIDCYMFDSGKVPSKVPSFFNPSHLRDTVTPYELM